MQNFALLVICLLLGAALRRLGRLPEATPAALNGFIVHVALPALVLTHVRRLPLDAALAYPVAMAWVLFGLGLAFFLFAYRVIGLSRTTAGALILTGALGNTSFVGLPMIESYFGRDYLAVGVLVDQLGTYLVLSTLGLLVAAILSSGTLAPTVIARRILSFPPFIALLAALGSASLQLPSWADSALERLSVTLAPLALISVGFQLRLGAIRARWKELTLGLSYKLVIGPVAILGMLAGVADLADPVMQVTVFEAAMAPMIGGAIVAVEHKLDPELVTLMVGIGIPASFVTLSLWSLVLAAL